MKIHQILAMVAVAWAMHASLAFVASPLAAFIPGSIAVLGLSWTMARDHKRKIARRLLRDRIAAKRFTGAFRSPRRDVAARPASQIGKVRVA